MALGGFNCPFCNHYNANDARKCYRCERVLPPAALAGMMRSLKLAEYPGTKVLAAISVIVFALQLADSGGMQGGLLRGMPISTLLRFGAIANETHAEPWRWLAACYVHMGLLHVGMNMLALVSLGRDGEAQVGSGLFVVSYVLTGIFGFYASTLWYGDTPYITAGASGAIFGLMGVALGERARRKDRAWKSMLVRTLVMSVLWYYMLNTNQAAHLGGLALGIAIGYFATARLTLRYPGSVLVAAAAGLLLSVASLVATQLSPGWRIIRHLEHREEIEQRFQGDN